MTFDAASLPVVAAALVIAFVVIGVVAQLIAASHASAMRRDFADAERAAASDRASLLSDAAAQSTRTRDTLEALTTSLRTDQVALRDRVGAELEKMRAAVDEKLQAALEKRVTESFSRVAEQFATIQRTLGSVQLVAEQAGDLKRLFSNVKARGGWGEAQLGALLADMLPADGFVSGYKPRPGAGEIVEFALRMPRAVAGEAPAWLPVDSKFPTGDYERVLAANDAGDRAAEAEARLSLTRRINAEAKRIGQKYICPPETADFAILYLPSDSLFAEVARAPGLIAALRTEHRVMVMGPSILPAFLHSLRVGHMTVALERDAAQIGRTLQAVRAEWEKFGAALEKMKQGADGLSKRIEATQVRARAVGRSLGSVGSIDAAEAASILGIEASAEVADEA